VRAIRAANAKSVQTIDDQARLMLAFATLAELLAPMLPLGAASLPRGYEWTVNTEGDRAFSKDGHLLAPGLGDPWPPLDVALAFAFDVKNGWLNELAQSVGLPGSLEFLEGIR
jgi:hypothetical protein